MPCTQFLSVLYKNRIIMTASLFSFFLSIFHSDQTLGPSTACEKVEKTN
jgi:hypothetical protein